MVLPEDIQRFLHVIAKEYADVFNADPEQIYLLFDGIRKIGYEFAFYNCVHVSKQDSDEALLRCNKNKEFVLQKIEDIKNGCKSTYIHKFLGACE